MNRIKELRIKHGYKNQKELADFLYVNQTAVSQWERGATIPSSQMLLKLSELYGVSIDYLLGRDEKEPVSGTTDRQSEDITELIRLYDQASPEMRAAALGMLRAAEAVRIVPDVREEGK